MTGRTPPPQAALLALPLAFLLALPPLAFPPPAAADGWQSEPPLPVRRSNNAVAAQVYGDTCYVYSFMGIDETRIWSGIRRDAWRLNTTTGSWQRLPDVPGPSGRIAAAAAAVGERVYVFGGYSVAQSGAETTWASVDIFDPATFTWTSGAPIPVRVDDQVLGVWNEQLVYLISGWSQTHSVTNVQVYDPAQDSWRQATPISGPAVFGGAGGVVGDTIVYTDGVDNGFTLRHAAFRGVIDPSDPTQIVWSALPPHPGARGYRMASGVPAGPGARVFFAGGTDNAYNFNGIGYNGVPSEPTDFAFAYDIVTQDWVTLAPKPTATMDHRGWVDCGGRLFVAGGFEAGQSVSSVTESYAPDATVGVGEADGGIGAGGQQGPGPDGGEDPGAGGGPPPVATSGIALRAAPLPGRASLTIRFNLPRAVRARVAVHDVQGRRVRLLHDGPLAAGAQALRWDLRDAGGARVARGVYLVRVDYGRARAAALKLVVEGR